MSEPCQSEPADASGNQAEPLEATQSGPTVNRSGAVRRVVQIVETDSRLTALCSDGSIWVTYDGSKWHELTPPPGCGGYEAEDEDLCGGKS